MVCAILDGNVYCIGVAKEVVHVAEDFLVGTDEEYAEIVVFVLLQSVDGQHVSIVPTGDEVGYFAVAVTGDVL